MSPQVLVLSPPRMGTQSMADALMILGYPKVYHMREVGKNGHARQWTELVHARFGPEKRRLQRADFEPVLGEFDGLADFPASVFIEDLIAAYPEAKIIFPQRDEDAWFRSMATNFAHLVAGVRDDASPMQPLRDALSEHCWEDDFLTYGRRFFREYQQRVRDATRGKAVLEFHVGRDGWETLCPFLGKDVPPEPYPNHDELRKGSAKGEAEGQKA